MTHAVLCIGIWEAESHSDLGRSNVGNDSLISVRTGVPVRWTQETSCDGSDSWERCLRGEEAARFNFGMAFFLGEKFSRLPTTVRCDGNMPS